MSAAWEAMSRAVMGAMLALPLWSVKLLVIAMFAGLAIWAMSLPRHYALRGAPDQAWWRDVRLWAVIVIGLEIIPYLFF